MSAAQRRPVTIGAVSYHPRVVTIWEAFRGYFEEQGVATDYVLYSNYERLVEALIAGDVDIAWNTNTAFLVAEHRVGKGTRILGMRDVDAGFATVIVAPKSAPFEHVEELAGKRLALGSRDSGHAAILPVHYLGRAGLDVAAQCELVRFDTDLGKHGDTGDSELRVIRAVAQGAADAGALGDATWARLVADGAPATGELAVCWRSPTYYHCNFTALPTFDDELAQRWQAALLAMDHNDPELRNAMDLEGVKRWLPGDRSGYADLEEAMRAQGYLP
ncbi:MAG: phosphate/phosphite/phosphonate ABC transporter substrate-binding protein [Actinomycetota bacterium]